MKIAIVSTTYPPYIVGGAELSVQELARGLAAAGHDVRVFCLGPEARGSSIERDGEVEIRRIASPGFRPFDTNGKNANRFAKVRWHFQEFGRISAFRFLRREFHSFEPDVVHSNNIAGFGWMAWKAAGSTPLVHTTRDYYLSCLTSTHWRNDAECQAGFLPCRLSKLPFRLTRRRPDVFVGVSDDIIARHRANGSIRTGERSLTIYNQPSLVPSAQSQVARKADAFVFGALGRIGSDKGTWTIIDAFKALPVEALGRSVELRIAGNGTAEDIDRVRQATHSDARITFVGLSNPTDFYSDVDCALVPTQWAEPFGRTAAEALASGAVLLASRTGGLPEVLSLYGGRGRLVDSYADASSWVEAMSQVITNPPGAQVASPLHLTASAVHEQYLDAYRSARSGMRS